jgi:hypothetical protein
VPQPIPPIPPDRPERPGIELRPAHSAEEANPIHKVLMSLPVLMVAAGFGAIVWLAYVEGQSTALGEPPLVKAIPEPIKIAPESGLAGGNDNPVEELLAEQVEPPSDVTLQPPPEQPILADPTPELAARQPTRSAATAPPADTGGEPQRALRTEPATPPSPAAGSGPSPAPAEASATPALPEAEGQPASEPEAGADAGTSPTRQTAPLPAPERPTPPPVGETELAAAQPAAQPTAVERRRPTPATEPSPRIARVTPVPAEPGGSRISPSGVEQTPPRLRLEPPPPVLATAPSPADSQPASSAAPPIIAAPDDDGRSATQPTYRIQLASVREEADARRAWDLYRLELGEVLSGFEPVIERAEIANGTFYRVQAGAFADRLAAEAVCEELKAQNTACLVVRR